MAKEKSAEARRPGAFDRTKKFLGDVWREVHPKTGRVTWPTFRSVRVSTIVVIFSSILLGVYIMFCDLILRKLYGLILGLGSHVS